MAKRFKAACLIALKLSVNRADATAKRHEPPWSCERVGTPPPSELEDHGRRGIAAADIAWSPRSLVPLGHQVTKEVRDLSPQVPTRFGAHHIKVLQAP